MRGQAGMLVFKCSVSRFGTSENARRCVHIASRQSPVPSRSLKLLSFIFESQAAVDSGRSNSSYFLTMRRGQTEGVSDIQIRSIERRFRHFSGAGFLPYDRSQLLAKFRSVFVPANGRCMLRSDFYQLLFGIGRDANRAVHFAWEFTAVYIFACHDHLRALKGESATAYHGPLRTQPRSYKEIGRASCRERVWRWEDAGAV